MLGRLVEDSGRAVRVRCLGGNRAGEIRLTRLLRAAVTLEETAPQAARRTSRRCLGRRVLAIQDTTVLRSARRGGEYLHVELSPADV